MLNLEHAKPDIIELNDAELQAVVGGNCIGDAFRAIGGAIKEAVEWVGGLISAACSTRATYAARSARGSGPGGRPSEFASQELLASLEANSNGGLLHFDPNPFPSGPLDVYSCSLTNKETYRSIVQGVARSSLFIMLMLSLTTAADAGGRGQIDGTFGPNGSNNVVVRDHRGDAPPGEISVDPP